MSKSIERLLSVALLFATVMLPCEGNAAGSRSGSTFVFVHPENTSFWCTAKSNKLVLPVDMPKGASSATLTVRGCGGYEVRYSNVSAKEIRIDLPAVTSWSTENVYDLSLSFDDASETIRHARVGLVKSYSSGAQGMTRCLSPVGTKLWSRASGRIVFAVPRGATSLAMNGEEINVGLDGARGWCAIEGLDCRNVSTLELRTGEVTCAAASLIGAGGCVITID